MLLRQKEYLCILFSLFCSFGWCAPNYNITLIHHINDMVEYNSNSNFGISDVWGYTDETGKEYAVVGYRFGTLIYDVSNINSPVLISDIIGPSNGDYYFHRDYKTLGDYLFIVNEMTGPDEGMQVLDLSPLPNGNVIKLNTYTGISQSHNLWIDENLQFAFIEKNYPENIHIVDISIPHAVQHISSFNYWDGDNCHDIYTRDNIAYISEGFNYEFGIYDISDQLSPVHLASIPSFGYAHNAWVNNSGTHLITSEETVGMTIKIWDIQNLNNINIVSEYLGENALAHNVHIKNNFLYISHYTVGLKILDIFDPTKPVEVAAFDTFPDNDDSGFYGCWGAYPFTNNNFVYASDMQNGLFVLSFDNIYAGWLKGTVLQNGLPINNVIIRSQINGYSYLSDDEGNYEIGFPEGEYVFDFIINDVITDSQILTFYPHDTIDYNIILNISGDINYDGIINILDIVSLANQILQNIFLENSDLNFDGYVNILDIIYLINAILNIYN